MKHYRLAFAFLALTILSACNKTDTTATLTTNSWSVGGTTYTATKVYRNNANTSLVMEDAASPANQFAVRFSTFPTATGTYNIVGTNSLAANQVAIDCTTNSNGTSASYQIFGASTPTVGVTVTNNKMTISFTNYWATKAGTADSVEVSANIIEP